MIDQRYYSVGTFMTPEDAAAAHDRREAFLARRAKTQAGRDASLAAMLAAAAPPESMGAAPVAPARGPMGIVDEISILPGSDVSAVKGYEPRLRIIGRFWREADPLSVMCRQAAIRHAESGSEADFVPPFSPGQIAIGRHYRALTERHDAGGVKLSSLEAGRDSGSRGGDFMDAYLALGLELVCMHRSIGDGSALVVRRIRPSARGSRVSIPDRRIVDMICLGGLTLSDVLATHGWTVDGKARKALRQALCAALDRMRGHCKKGT